MATGENSRFRRAGTTTSCGAWTICGRPGPVPMNERLRPSTWWRGSNIRTDDGHSITPTPARSTSTWRVGVERRAAGTPSVRCGCWTGIQPNANAEDERRAPLDGGRWAGRADPPLRPSPPFCIGQSGFEGTLNGGSLRVVVNPRVDALDV